TSSPNGSPGATVMAGGGAGVGICARAPDRPRPVTKAANRGSRKIRETTIEIPREPVPGGGAVRRNWTCSMMPGHFRNTRLHKRLAIKSRQPYNRKHIGKIEAWGLYPIL